jgi:hypothetical protein
MNIFFVHPVYKQNYYPEVTGENSFVLLMHTPVGHSNYSLSALLLPQLFLFCCHITWQLHAGEMTSHPLS